MKKNMKTLLSFLLVLMLIAATALAMTACQGTQETPVPTATDSVDTTPALVETTEIPETTVGEGAKSFHFEVADLDGNTTYFLVKTDADTVGKALLDVELIEGEESAYGLYVKKVNGVIADYDVDQTYWAFYVNGEYAQTGVDTTNVEDGATYAFRISK